MATDNLLPWDVLTRQTALYRINTIFQKLQRFEAILSSHFSPIPQYDIYQDTATLKHMIKEYPFRDLQGSAYAAARQAVHDRLQEIDERLESIESDLLREELLNDDTKVPCRTSILQYAACAARLRGAPIGYRLGGFDSMIAQAKAAQAATANETQLSAVFEDVNNEERVEIIRAELEEARKTVKALERKLEEAETKNAGAKVDGAKDAVVDGQKISAGKHLRKYASKLSKVVPRWMQK